MKGNMLKRTLAVVVAFSMLASANSVVIAQELIDAVGQTATDVIQTESASEGVASIGSTAYATLSEALTAAKDGETVTLLADAELTKTTITTDVTLNLNGKTVTVADGNGNYTVVIKDKLTIEGEGDVVVNGLYGFGLSTSCTGGLTINDGNFSITQDLSYMIGAFAGTVEINGGTFNAPYCVVNSFAGYNADVVITGGTFIQDGSVDLSAAPLLGINFEVSGGSFNKQLIHEYYADGYGQVYTDGMFVVEEVDDVATFKGGSLRVQKQFETADLRFRYIIDDKLPEGAEITYWYWYYGLSEDNLCNVSVGEKFEEVNGKTISNIIFTGIGAENYKSNIYTKLVVEYELDGVTYIVADDEVYTRNIYQIAEAVLADETATASAKAYAQGLIDYYTENVTE